MSNNVGCTAVSVDENITSVWTGGSHWLSMFGSPQHIYLSTTYVPNFGTMYVQCTLFPGGQVNVINYTP